MRGEVWELALKYLNFQNLSSLHSSPRRNLVLIECKIVIMCKLHNLWINLKKKMYRLDSESDTNWNFMNMSRNHVYSAIKLQKLVTGIVYTVQ